MTDAKTIADSLTKAKKAAVRLGRGPYASLTSPEIWPLWDEITKLEDGQFEMTLNDLGLAVRKHIQEG